ncbi:hypothetical protein I6J42_34835 (plasmid) [Streptomyces californicus]|uniref:Uncharacterized protein n=1 Tax=Streptomyces californicus TaxID=67351 RepID=A0ABD7D707_9ACTN|nr:hypothetical protein [Streptomyces californicus]QRV39264.1 hypothetical protein I6J42_34835 [Streptomyces californicus]QRV52718.1 hypothetical protein I6J43_34860 [Streptomyces californicus]
MYATTRATTRDAAHAFRHLLLTTATAVADPYAPGIDRDLPAAAAEAHRALTRAGLLARPTHELIALVRAEFPNYNPTV